VPALDDAGLFDNVDPLMFTERDADGAGLLGPAIMGVETLGSGAATGICIDAGDLTFGSWENTQLCLLHDLTSGHGSPRNKPRLENMVRRAWSVRTLPNAPRVLERSIRADHVGRDRNSSVPGAGRICEPSASASDQPWTMPKPRKSHPPRSGPIEQLVTDMEYAN
jgi:hypothetical protein